MKLLAIILKNMKEQIRNYKVLLLSLVMGPFFIFVYYLITSTSEQKYKLLIVEEYNSAKNETVSLTVFFQQQITSNKQIPFEVKSMANRQQAINLLSDKKADALIVIPKNFPEKLRNNETAPEVEFVGDLTNTAYLLSAVYANDMLAAYAQQQTNTKPIVKVHETALGQSGSVSEFDMLVPGILIVSIIMLMFTASIAFVSEVENKTILRLRLSKLTALEFLGGITVVQTVLGILSLLLTLFTAQLLGFQCHERIFTVILVAAFVSISIISFSLIIAAFTRSATEVLVVGNFPMFLFMFFTGAAFPLPSNPLFSILGYPISLQGLMTPTHAISALNKILILNNSFSEIIPELIAILVLSVIYFSIGAILFKRRHLKLLVQN
jgi:ABC-2 type transport system permease protein